HRAECRTAFDSEGGAGLLEELARRADVVFERDHGHEHAHLLRARQTDERRELGPQQPRVPQQEPYATEPEGWVCFARRTEEGQRLVTADVEEADRQRLVPERRR